AAARAVPPRADVEVLAATADQGRRVSCRCRSRLCRGPCVLLGGRRCHCLPKLVCHKYRPWRARQLIDTPPLGGEEGCRTLSDTGSSGRGAAMGRPPIPGQPVETTGWV